MGVANWSRRRNNGAAVESVAVTGADLDKRVDALCRSLPDGLLSPGAHAALMCENSLAFVIAREAVTRLEARLVPINPGLAAPEVEHILRQSGAPVVLVSPALKARVQVAVTRLPQPPVLVALVLDPPGQVMLVPSESHEAEPSRIGATTIFTSGTSGWPKGCVRSAVAEAARAQEIISTYGLTEDDVQIIAGPLAHSAPGIFLRAGLAAGAKTVVMPRFRPQEFLQLVADARATFFFLVPTQYQRLLDLGAQTRTDADLSSVRAAIVAGAPLHSSLRRQLVDWFGDGRLWEFYGSSETGTISVLRPEDQLRHASSVGRVLDSVDIKILAPGGKPAEPGQVGELFVRSPTIMDGYLEPESGSAGPKGPDGFISVRDLGLLSADGFLSLVDRADDTIISGGLNVYPAEVERALVEHNQISAAVAFGIADPDWGQRVCAVVATVSEQRLEPGELREFLRARLAGYKVPKAFAQVAAGEMPVGASGKPLRRRAAEQFMALSSMSLQSQADRPG